MANNKRKPMSFPELDQMEPRTEPKGRRAILRSIEEVEAEQQAIQDAEDVQPMQNQEAGNPEYQHSSIPASLQARKPESQQAGDTASQQASNKSWYTKVTYRLSPDTIDAIEEAKRILRRKYKLKVSLEEIAEEAIVAACSDLLENQHSSILVNKIASKQAKQKAGKGEAAPR